MNTMSLKSQTIALAPFNAVSMALTALLEKQGIKVISIFDNNKKVQGKYFREIPIVGATEDAVRDATVIVCSFISLKQIIKQLEQLSARKLISYEEILNREDLEEMMDAFEKIKADGSLDNINEYHKNVMFCSGDLSLRAALLPKESQNGVVLPLLTVILTEACSLKCKECSHLMQYFVKPRTYDMDTILSNFDKLYNATSFIRNLSISGGEPFLHNRLADIVDHLASYENIGYIGLTTNGTIMPDEEVIKRFSKHDNLIIRLSDYGQHSKYKNAIAEMCYKYGVRYALLNNMTWYGGLRITEFTGDYNVTQSTFNVCSTKDILLAEHSFAKCHLGLFADKLGAIPKSAPGMCTCLDVSDINFSSEKLREYLESDEPLQACSICSGVSRIREQVPPAEQLKEPLPYKLYK